MEEEEAERGEITDEFVAEVLREGLKIVTKSHNKKKNPQINIQSAIKSTLSEFTTCYRLFGYDLSGKPISIMSVDTAMEKSALDNLFMEKFGAFMSKRVDLE